MWGGGGKECPQTPSTTRHNSDAQHMTTICVLHPLLGLFRLLFFSCPSLSCLITTDISKHVTTRCAFFIVYGCYFQEVLEGESLDKPQSPDINLEAVKSELLSPPAGPSGSQMAKLDPLKMYQAGQKRPLPSTLKPTVPKVRL